MSENPISNLEDYQDYLADKGLHEAYKIRDAVQITHSYDRLLRMWIDHLSEQQSPATVSPAQPIGADHD